MERPPAMSLRVLRMPVRFKRIYRSYHGQVFNLLDVGCGPGSPSQTLNYFERCHYYAIDREARAYNDRNRALIRRFFELDLDRDPLDEVPDAFFDVILFSHVIEHLHRGLDVLASLTRKLKPGGVIYIEYPGIRSLATPHARRSRDCMHFCDDATHVRLYSAQEIVNVLLGRGMVIVKAGTRRDAARVLLSPAMFLVGVLKGSPWNHWMWDLCGFAEYVFARRPEVPAEAGAPASAVHAEWAEGRFEQSREAGVSAR
jgi:SAM-dependent methyltransferase